MKDSILTRKWKWWQVLLVLASLYWIGSAIGGAIGDAIHAGVGISLLAQLYFWARRGPTARA